MYPSLRIQWPIGIESMAFTRTVSGVALICVSCVPRIRNLNTWLTSFLFYPTSSTFQMYLLLNILVVWCLTISGGLLFVPPMAYFSKTGLSLVPLRKFLITPKRTQWSSVHKPHGIWLESQCNTQFNERDIWTLARESVIRMSPCLVSGCSLYFNWTWSLSSYVACA